MKFTDILMLIGGLGMFLYGMKMMSDGLERVAGDRLKSLLEYLTRNRIIGMLVGALFTMIIQSSSATTVMVVGFVNAGLMNLLQAAPVIMGANIGTTITAQIIALDITKYAPLIVAVGVILSMMKKKKTVQLSEVLVGFGFLFMGLSIMSESLSSLREVESFKNFMVSFTNPILGVMAGAIFTAIIQSSSASVGILQAIAAEGLIGLGGATYVLMGQNIGTCITALLASINTNKTARRAAVIHLLFNTLGTVLFSIIISMIPIVPFYERIFAGNPMQQIAAVHISFNVLGVVVFLPLTKVLVKISTLLVRGEDPKREPMRLAYLDARLLTTPNIAVGQLVKEIDRMGKIAVDNLTLSIESISKYSEAAIDELEDHEKVINYLEHEITTYLINLNQLDLPEHDSQMVGSFFHVVNDIERVGDHAMNIHDYVKKINEENIHLSSEGINEINEMYAKVREILELSLQAFRTRDHALLVGIYPLEQRIDEMEKQLANRHIERLTNNICNLRSGMIFTDLASNLERVADHATNIAFSIENA